MKTLDNFQDLPYRIDATVAFYTCNANRSIHSHPNVNEKEYAFSLIWTNGSLTSKS